MMAMMIAMEAAPVAASNFATIDAMAAREWQNGNFGRAIALWVQSAEQFKSVEAMYNLGQAYRLGKGVPKDDRTAMYYYKRAADAGFVRGEEQLGLIYFNDPSTRDLALMYLEKAALKGAPRAAFVVGVARLRGDGMSQDFELARQFLIVAKDKGVKNAASALEEAEQGLRSAAQPAKAAKVDALAVAVNATRPVEVPAAQSRPAAETGPVILPAVRSAGTSIWSVKLGAFDSMPIANVKWLRISHRHRLLNYAPRISEAGGKFELSFGGFAGENEAQAICDGLIRKKTKCMVSEGF